MLKKLNINNVVNTPRKHRAFLCVIFNWFSGGNINKLEKSLRVRQRGMRFRQRGWRNGGGAEKKGVPTHAGTPSCMFVRLQDA